MVENRGREERGNGEEDRVDSTRGSKSNCYTAEEWTCVYNRLFGNIVDENKLAKHGFRSFRRNDIHGKRPPSPPRPLSFFYVRLCQTWRGRFYSISTRYFRIVGSLHTHLRNTRWTRILVKAIGLKHRWRIIDESRFEVFFSCESEYRRTRNSRKIERW